MIVLSINLLILSVGILIVGLIKPGWILFWVENPQRMPIVGFSVVLFMISVVMFGEANQENIDEAIKPSESIEVSDTSIPAPEKSLPEIK